MSKTQTFTVTVTNYTQAKMDVVMHYAANSVPGCVEVINDMRDGAATITATFEKDHASSGEAAIRSKCRALGMSA